MGGGVHVEKGVKEELKGLLEELGGYDEVVEIEIGHEEGGYFAVEF